MELSVHKAALVTDRHLDRSVTWTYNDLHSETNLAPASASLRTLTLRALLQSIFSIVAVLSP